MLPSWLETGANMAGQVVGLPLQLLGAFAQGALGQQQPGTSDPMDPRTWQHPERYAMALQVVPNTLPPEVQQERMTRLFHTPFKLWNDIFHEYKTEDRKNADLMQTDAYRRALAEGGPDYLRALNWPQPPHMLMAQDAPLSAEAQARGETAPSMPNRASVPILPPRPVQDVAKDTLAQNQIFYAGMPGPTGDLFRQRLAGVGDTPAQKGAETFETTQATARANATPLGRGLGSPNDIAEQAKIRDEQRQADAQRQDKINAAIIKSVSVAAADANKQQSDQAFVQKQIQPIKDLIPSLPDKEFANTVFGAGKSIYRKLSNFGGTSLELDGYDVPMTAKNTAALVVANIGRRFGEKGVFTDRDLARFMDVLDISNSSQKSATTKLASIDALTQELSARVAAKEAGQPFSLPEGAQVLTPEQVSAALGQTNAAPRPNAQATPGAVDLGHGFQLRMR